LGPDDETPRERPAARPPEELLTRDGLQHLLRCAQSDANAGFGRFEPGDALQVVWPFIQALQSTIVDLRCEIRGLENIGD